MKEKIICDECKRVCKEKDGGWMQCFPRFFICNTCYWPMIKSLKDQPERSKREDTCNHEWGSENLSDSARPFYSCNKCDAVL
jgi:hypothetical protein